MNTLTFDIVERGDVITPLPRHIWEGKDWNDPTKNSEIDNPSVVSGPWKMKEWNKGKNWTVVRNDAGNTSVWPAPNLDQLTVITVENASIGFQKIKSGEADAFEGTQGFASQDVAEAETLPNVTVYKWTPANALWQHIAFNFRKPIFKDLALRQALTWVIDRKAIADKVYFGLAVPMYSDVPPSSDKYNESVVEKYGYDPAKAKQILKDAGYTLKDGKLVDPSGTPLPKLKFVYSSNGAEAGKIAAIAQQEWKDLGIDLDLIGVDFNTVLKTIQQPPFDFDMVTLGWSANLNPEGFGDVWKTIPNLNFGAWTNDQVNQLYAQTQREFDNSKRKEIMSQIQTIESKDGPYIYLVAQTAFAAVNKRIGGVTATPLGIGMNNVVNDLITSWYIK
jgi:peptide/nickel transport system substrate-binding protein